MMALLDMQGMDLASRGNSGGGGSDLSVLLCDSLVSTTLCL
jgi:Lanthionine-containing peptide SapB precursor RamS